MPSVNLTPYDARLAEIRRQQQLAELLQQQSADPIQTNFGGVLAPVSPYQGAAKLANAIAAAFARGRAEKEQKALEADQRQQATDTLNQFYGDKLQYQIPDIAKGLETAAPPPGPQPPPPPDPNGPPVQPVAPPPQQDPTVNFPQAMVPTSAQDRARIAAQAVGSGNPYLSQIAPQMYSEASREAEKDTERERMLAAVDKLPLGDTQKTLVRQIAEFGGPAAASSAVESLLKPPNQPDVVKSYMFAKQNGYTGSFIDYQKDTNPNKFLLNVAPGHQVFGSSDLVPAAPTTSAPLSALVSQAFPDAKITSTFRTPAQNAAAHGVPNSEHMQPDGAIDFVLGSPEAMQAAVAQINTQPGFRAIYEGPGAANSTGPHVHVQRVETATPASNGPPKPLVSVPALPRATASAWGLTDAEQAALNKAVGEGKVDLKGLNSRTGKITAQAFLANPNLDAIGLHAIAQGTSNPLTQRTVINMSSVPEMVQNIAAAGKALNYSDVQFVGKLQQWKNGQLNDPAFTNYMTQRKDGLLSIAAAFRGASATDIATKMEDEAQRPTLSPRAIDGWVKGQLISAKPRLERLAQYDRTGQAKAALAMIQGMTRSRADILKQYGIH